MHAPNLKAILATGAVAALVAAGCATSTPTTSPTTTTTSTISSTTTTGATACAPFGSTDDVSGAAAVTRSPAIALLANVQVQASACVDEVSFLFLGGTPAWSAAYRDGPFTEDPSGRPVAVAGASHLVVRFEPASGVDLSQDRPIENYDGPTRLHPVPPSAVAEVARLGDFEAVTTWVLGLPERRPFEVVLRPEQVVVRILPPASRTTRCPLPDASVTIGYPRSWFAELSDRWACRYLDPAPFVVHPNTNDFAWAVTAQPADVSAGEVLARMTGGDADVTRRATTVAGHAATVLDVVERGSGLLPAGYGYRMYIVDTGPHALTLVGAAAPQGPQTAANRAAVDRIAALVEA